MAVLNDLIAQIENEELRRRIEAEVERLNKQKKFGLVFEDHLPECTPLYDIPVKVGSSTPHLTLHQFCHVCVLWLGLMTL